MRYDLRKTPSRRPLGGSVPTNARSANATGVFACSGTHPLRRITPRPPRWSHRRVRVTQEVDMASARITQRWADGTELEMEVEVDTAFPDSIREVCVQVLTMRRGQAAAADMDEQP